MSPRQTNSSLLTLLLTLLSIFATVARAERHSIPPPLPTTSYAGKSELDYDDLHRKYEDALTCLWIPLGVFGFYYYLAQFLVSVLTLATTLRENATRNLIAGLINFAFNSIAIAQNAMTVQTCAAVNSHSANQMAGWSTTALLASSAALLGDLFMLLNAGRLDNKWAWIGAVSAHGLSFASLILAGLFYAAPIMFPWSLGVSSLTDRVELSASLAAALPPLIILGGITLTGFALHPKAWAMWVVLAAGAVILFLNAITFVGAGKIQGDPWGGWFFREWKIAKADIASMCIFPPLLAVIAVWEGGLTVE